MSALLKIATASFILMVVGLSSVRAADLVNATLWKTSEHASIRLIPGATRDDGARWVGVHIELEEGWHTYWRHPGASGVPPRLDWAGSQNLEAATLKWPAPRRLRDEYGVSFGYLDEVVFPVLISPEARGGMVGLKLAIDYAVCREICIPEFTELQMDLVANADALPVFKRLVAGFVNRVPRLQAADAEPFITDTSLETVAGQPVLRITANLGVTSLGAAEQGGAKTENTAVGGDTPAAEVFVEGPEAFYFSAPDGPQMIDENKGQFLVEIKGASSVEALAGARLGATLVTPVAAVEHWWTVP